MNLNDLILTIKSSKTNSALVDVGPHADVPGYTRSTSIDWSNKIVIAFQPGERGLGGPVFWGNYPTLEAAVQDLETYFGNRLHDWPSWSPIVPAYTDLPEAEKDKADLLLAEAIRSESLQRPSPAFILRSGEWRYCFEFFAVHKTFFDTVLGDPDAYAAMQNYARMLSSSGRSRSEIMGIFSAGHSYCLRRNLPEDVIADVMDGISNSFGKGNPHNLDLP